MISPLVRQKADALFAAVAEDTRTDLASALEWATATLREQEGGGHAFQLFSEGQGSFSVTFSKPEWAGEHSTRYQGELGSEAIVMAVCEYLSGA